MGSGEGKEGDMNEGEVAETRKESGSEQGEKGGSVDEMEGSERTTTKARGL